MSDQQLELFSLGVTQVLDASKMTPEEYYKKFSTRNPHVYKLLVRMAREFIEETGAQRMGFRMLWEVLRWRFARAVKTDDAYLLNNNLQRFYVRDIIANEPDLATYFETRDRKDAA